MCSGGPPWESHSIPWLDSLSFFLNYLDVLALADHSGVTYGRNML